MSDRPTPPETPDIHESGRGPDGQRIVSHQRLFMQLHVWTHAHRDAAEEALGRCPLPAVLYHDAHDPFGLALLSWSQDPNDFLDALQPFLREEPFGGMTPRPELSLFGRTYSLGYEPDLNETLFARPVRHVTTPDWPWAIWYPLRRAGSFERLTPEEQRKVLMEHGQIGHAFGAAGFAHDVRLACHGMDPADNDFVIGLLGPELHPLSALVQRMRKTQQTSQHLERLGPFFVGRVAGVKQA